MNKNLTMGGTFMKRTTTMLIALLFCLFIFTGCDCDLSKNSNSQSTNDTVDTSADHVSEENSRRVYIHEESDDVFKPSITLFDDHKCSFTFSALSSYLGIGTYTIEDDFFVLNTDDGLYTYTFKIEGEDMDRLIFVADKSSDYIHQGQFEDGSVFEGTIVRSTN
jgi:hypothetical protein